MIDLHVHSKCSDGSDDVCDLIENIRNANIDTFALTDHDTAEGCRKILSSDFLKQKLEDYNIKFVTGAEWSCIYGKQKMHILAYGFDAFDERILSLEKQMRDMLDRKDKYRMQALQEMGFKFSQSSKDYLSQKENIRSMDFAKCLIADGYFDDLQKCFKECLNTIKYPFVCRFDAVEMLKILSSCGAKIVWAHSIYDLKRKVTPYEEVDRIIKELKPYGLQGLECYYSLYSQDEIDTLVQIAKDNELFVTCGSDYHGKNKEVQLAQFSDENDVFVNLNENELRKIVGAR